VNVQGPVNTGPIVNYGHRHGVIGRTLIETAGELAAILYNSVDGGIVCVMLLATFSLPKRNAAHGDHFAFFRLF
jgi:hypothetical protein